MKKIIIGARGSKLSLIQTNIIKKLLLTKNPSLQIDVITIKTIGDSNMSPIPLDTIGKGWFTNELDKALLQKKIDLAVHSLKDLPEKLPDGLCISAIPKRENAAEALVAKNGYTFNDLPKGAVIGTDSTRRKAQILHKRNDLVVKSIRGNVNKRIEKLDNGEYDALVLAVAGLNRLGMSDRITQYFSITDIIPSPGQGALAVVTRASDKTLNTLLKKINHEPTLKAVTAERAFSKTFGGGCKMPVGAYANTKDNTLVIHGMVGSPDGARIEQAVITGDHSKPGLLGKELAKRLLQKATWYTNKKRFIITTRPEENDDKLLTTALKKSGLAVFSYPTITISKNLSMKKEAAFLRDLSSYDWLVFTSKNGVRYFMDAIKQHNINTVELANNHIAVVGNATAEEIKKQRLPVHFVPTKFTTDDLGKQMPQIQGKKLLLARSHIANPSLIKILRQKGASVINMPIYKTSLTENKSKKLLELLQNDQVSCITFTSPSTVAGFMQQVFTEKQKEKIFSIPVISIGPVTTKAAKKHGFQIVYTAETHTIEGLLTKLKQTVL